VSRTVSKQFGINWEAFDQQSNFLLGLATGNPASMAGNLIPRTPGTDALFARIKKGGADVNVLVDALADEGLITVLAEPSLTAMSGETASFLAGGEFPIPLAQDNNKVTVEFKQFGISLAFTPTLIGESRINLKVRPEVSQLSSAGAIKISALEIPALTTRRANTTVELGSGQSFAIAGLLQNNGNQGINKFPMLGDLPVLGALFRSTKFQRDETELVIIVTPYLVRATSDRLALPTDGFVAPDDAQRITKGRMVGEASATPPARPVHAPEGGQ
jgi:pilus assembly protein CpaC